MFSVLPDLSRGFGIPSMAPTFMQLDFKGIFSLDFFVIMFAFLFVDLFDTLGTLIGVASKADIQKRILLETGQMPSSPKIHLEEYKEQIPRMCNAVEAIRGADRIIEVPDNLWTADQLENFRNQIMEVLNGTLDEEQFCTNLYQ